MSGTRQLNIANTIAGRRDLGFDTHPVISPGGQLTLSCAIFASRFIGLDLVNRSRGCGGETEVLFDYCSESNHYGVPKSQANLPMDGPLRTRVSSSSALILLYQRMCDTSVGLTRYMRIMRRQLPVLN